VPLTSAQATYTLGRSGSPDVTTDRPLRIYEADRKETSTGITTSLTRLTLDEYENLPNKNQTGVPTQYFFEPTLNNSTLKLWPAPDATTASDYTVELVVQAPLEDLDSGTDDFDFPQYWLEAIIYGLAVRLAPRYGGLGIQERSMLRREAKEVLDLAISFDVEYGSIYFGYEGR
jgi:hypothetical protein